MVTLEDTKTLPARVIQRPIKTSMVYHALQGDVDYGGCDAQYHIHGDRVQRQGSQLRGPPYWHEQRQHDGHKAHQLYDEMFQQRDVATATTAHFE